AANYTRGTRPLQDGENSHAGQTLPDFDAHVFTGCHRDLGIEVQQNWSRALHVIYANRERPDRHAKDRDTIFVAGLDLGEPEHFRLLAGNALVGPVNVDDDTAGGEHG